MKLVKNILTFLFDPISSVVSRYFPDVAFKVTNKNLIVQVLIAVVITLCIIFIGR